jgi:hypothetical protein
MAKRPIDFSSLTVAARQASANQSSAPIDFSSLTVAARGGETESAIKPLVEEDPFKKKVDTGLSGATSFLDSSFRAKDSLFDSKNELIRLGRIESALTPDERAQKAEEARQEKLQNEKFENIKRQAMFDGISFAMDRGSINKGFMAGAAGVASGIAGLYGLTHNFVNPVDGAVEYISGKIQEAETGRAPKTTTEAALETADWMSKLSQDLIDKQKTELGVPEEDLRKGPFDLFSEGKVKTGLTVLASEIVKGIPQIAVAAAMAPEAAAGFLAQRASIFATSASLSLGQNISQEYGLDKDISAEDFVKAVAKSTIEGLTEAMFMGDVNALKGIGSSLVKGEGAAAKSLIKDVIEKEGKEAAKQTIARGFSKPMAKMLGKGFEGASVLGKVNKGGFEEGIEEVISATGSFMVDRVADGNWSGADYNQLKSDALNSFLIAYGTGGSMNAMNATLTMKPLTDEQKAKIQKFDEVANNESLPTDVRKIAKEKADEIVKYNADLSYSDYNKLANIPVERRIEAFGLLSEIGTIENSKKDVKDVDMIAEIDKSIGLKKAQYNLLLTGLKPSTQAIEAKAPVTEEEKKTAEQVKTEQQAYQEELAKANESFRITMGVPSEPMKVSSEFSIKTGVEDLGVNNVHEPSPNMPIEVNKKQDAKKVQFTTKENPDALLEGDVYTINQGNNKFATILSTNRNGVQEYYVPELDNATPFSNLDDAKFAVQEKLTGKLVPEVQRSGIDRLRADKFIPKADVVVKSDEGQETLLDPAAKKSIQNAVKAFKSVSSAPVYLYRSTEDFKKGVALELGEDSKALEAAGQVGGGFFTNKRDEDSIHINLANLTQTSLAHELFHGTVVSVARQNPSAFAEMRDAIITKLGENDLINVRDSKGNSQKLTAKEYLTLFSNQYAPAQQAEEFLGELTGLLTSDIAKLKDATIWETIKLGIRNLVKSAGIDIPVFEKTANINDTVKFFNDLAKSLQTGKEINISKLNLKDEKQAAKQGDVKGETNEQSKNREKDESLQDDVKRAVKKAAVAPPKRGGNPNPTTVATGLSKKALDIDPTTPEDYALQYFIKGGKVLRGSIKQGTQKGALVSLFTKSRQGGDTEVVSEMRPRLALTKGAPFGLSLDAIAERLFGEYQANISGGDFGTNISSAYDYMNFRGAVESVLIDNRTAGDMAESIIKSKGKFTQADSLALSENEEYEKLRIKAEADAMGMTEQEFLDKVAELEDTPELEAVEEAYSQALDLIEDEDFAKLYELDDSDIAKIDELMAGVESTDGALDDKLAEQKKAVRDLESERKKVVLAMEKASKETQLDITGKAPIQEQLFGADTKSLTDRLQSVDVQLATAKADAAATQSAIDFQERGTVDMFSEDENNLIKEKSTDILKTLKFGGNEQLEAWTEELELLNEKISKLESSGKGRGMQSLDFFKEQADKYSKLVKKKKVELSKIEAELTAREKLEEVKPTKEAAPNLKGVMISGLSGGFKALTNNALDPRSDQGVMDKIMSNESFATTATLKGKKYAIVGLRLKQDVGAKTLGRDGYTFASIEDDGNLPANIVDVLTQNAIDSTPLITSIVKNPTIESFKPISKTNIEIEEAKPTKEAIPSDVLKDKNGKPLVMYIGGKTIIGTGLSYVELSTLESSKESSFAKKVGFNTATVSLTNFKRLNYADIIFNNITTEKLVGLLKQAKESGADGVIAIDGGGNIKAAYVFDEVNIKEAKVAEKPQAKEKAAPITSEPIAQLEQKLYEAESALRTATIGRAKVTAENNVNYLKKAIEDKKAASLIEVGEGKYNNTQIRLADSKKTTPELQSRLNDVKQELDVLTEKIEVREALTEAFRTGVNAKQDASLNKLVNSRIELKAEEENITKALELRKSRETKAPIESKASKEIESINREIQQYEIEIENALEEIENTKSNYKEDVNRIAIAKMDLKAAKLSRDEKADRLEELKAEVEDLADERDTYIEQYKDDIANAKADIKKLNKRLAKLQESATSAKFQKQGISVAPKSAEETNAQFLATRNGTPIGFNYDTDLVARERFNIPTLKKIGEGSDRVVFDLGDNKVLKVAKTARGLAQNIHEGSYDLVEEGILPEVFESGLNYIVADKVEPAKGNKAVNDLIRDLKNFTQRDFDTRNSRLQDVLEANDLSYVMNYDVLYGDLSAARNWGVKNGKPIHLDGGTFGGVQMINQYKGIKNLEDSDFRDVYNKSRQAKTKFGDKDTFTKFQKQGVSVVPTYKYQMNEMFKDPQRLTRDVAAKYDIRTTLNERGKIEGSLIEVERAITDQVVTRALSKVGVATFKTIGAIENTPLFKAGTGKTVKLKEALTGWAGYTGNNLRSATLKAIQSNNKYAASTARVAASLIGNLAKSDVLQQQRALRSGSQLDANNSIAMLSKGLNGMIGFDDKALMRVHSLLDPEAFEIMGSEDAVTSPSDLSLQELRLYNTLRDMNDFIHEWHYQNEFIDQPTYDKHKGKYFARMYEEIERKEFADLHDAIDKMPSGADFRMFKARKDFSEIELTLMNDPIYITSKRLATMLHNKATLEFCNAMAADPSYTIYKNAADIPENNVRGFKLLDSRGGGKRYGDLTNKYVPLALYEELRGTTFANKFVSASYDALRMYDGLAVRQFFKKTKTLYNPTTRLGNITTNFAFAWLAGVDPFTMMKNRVKAKDSLDNYDDFAKDLAVAGVLGTDVITADLSQKKDAAGVVGFLEKVGLNKEIANKAREVDKYMIESYGRTDDVAKISLYRSLIEDYGKSKEEALRTVGESMQNYATVGKAYQYFSKMPLIGNPFVKFSSDMARIVANGFAKRPLYMASFLGMMYGTARLLSNLSGEPEEEREARESRAFIPKIPLGFTDIPLTWKVGKYEVNAARFISPYYVYDAGYRSNTIAELTKFAPIQLSYDNKVGIAADYAPVMNDPFIAPLVQTYILDKDFRGLPIADPNGSKYTAQTVSESEATWNRYNYLGHSYASPLWGYISNLYSAATGQGDLYGRRRDIPSAILNSVIKVQEMESKDIQKAVINQVKYIDSEYKQIKTDITSRRNDDVEKIQEVIGSDATESQKENQILNIQTSYSNFVQERVGRMEELKIDRQLPLDRLYKIQNPKKND